MGGPRNPLQSPHRCIGSWQGKGANSSWRTQGVVQEPGRGVIKDSRNVLCSQVPGGAPRKDPPASSRAGNEPPQSQGAEKEVSKPTAWCGSSQHTPAASLGAVDCKRYSPSAAPLYLCLMWGISICNRLQACPARAAQPMPGGIFPCSQAFHSQQCWDGGLSIIPIPASASAFIRASPCKACVETGWSSASIPGARL